MPEVNQDTDIKIVAFYLPQFHSIPENDQWWGKGFTEWVNTKKAVPQFPGHYQPRLPYGDNYYCLLDDSTFLWQADIAKKYGVYGFCYYHYWFKGGKKLLEKPIEQMLKNPDIDMPFCLSWANENWSRNWDGGNREVIMEQEYGDETEWEAHFQYLLSFFRDKRYIAVDGKPIFIIYKPGLIDRLEEMLAFFSARAIAEGLRGICFMFQHPYYYKAENYQPELFDYTINFEPGYTRFMEYGREMNGIIARIMRRLKYHYRQLACGCKNISLTISSYDEDWDKILKRDPILPDKTFPGAFVDWDNTPRNKNGITYIGAGPDKFEAYMTELIRLTKQKYHQQMIFVNAWNEWGEGAYLEPDQKYGYGYLEALKKALDSSRG